MGFSAARYVWSEVSNKRAMIPPTLLVRDTALAGVILTGLALFWGGAVAAVVAVGAVAAFVNLLVLVFAARQAVAGGRGGVLLPMKFLLAVGLVMALVSFLPPIPVLIGFGAGPLGILLCGIEAARILPDAETP